jgi:hypothetical protein
VFAIYFAFAVEFRRLHLQLSSVNSGIEVAGRTTLEGSERDCRELCRRDSLDPCFCLCTEMEERSLAIEMDTPEGIQGCRSKSPEHDKLCDHAQKAKNVLMGEIYAVYFMIRATVELLSVRLVILVACVRS